MRKVMDPGAGSRLGRFALSRLGHTGRGSGWRLLAAATSAITLTAIFAPVTRAEAKPSPRALQAQQVASIQGKRVMAQPRPADLSQGAAAARKARAAWPGAASAVAGLTGSAASSGAAIAGRGADLGFVRAGTTPVWIKPRSAANAKIYVDVLDRAAVPAAWRDGVVFRLGRGDGLSTAVPASVSVDYTAFADAFGGDWSSRLRLSVLPECALLTPQAPACQPTVLPSRNSLVTRRVSAEISVPGSGGVASAGTPAATSTLTARSAGGVMLAVTAGATSAAGDFTASSLQPASTWAAGTNSGSFSWSYKLRTPPSLGGPAPTPQFAYSSGAVDGRSEATNNQPSWIGEGFDYWTGYIERRYAPCADDMGSGANNSTATGDECWSTDNATMSLDGRGGELIKDGTTGTWRLKNDDASKIEHLTNTVNEDDNHEYWKITGADGTQYFFGLNRLPGYTGTAPANKTTASTWTVPVAGNNTGEPCHASSFASSFCTQAWRWNLDYVVDTHGNTMSLFYTPETNKYGRNGSASDAASYVRGGVIDHIDYGTDQRSGTDTENTSTMAPMRVDFGTADRCLTSCADHANWPDTPWDRDCAASPCTDKLSPTFWTTKRLATVTTKVWNASTSAYKPVDQWTLAHNFPDPGDGTRAGLWLESIVHSGQASGAAVIGSAIALPEINFDWVQMPNRVDSTSDGKPAMNWMRMSTIWTETGGKIDVRYSGPECVAGSNMPSSPQANTKRCYPVLFKGSGGTITTDYFHKYLVTSVTEADRTGGGPDVVTNYEYVGTPAWRHTDDDGITKDNLRTWSDYRGYAQVNTRKGILGSGTESLSETVYFRGMHGDLDGSGGTKTVTLAAVDGNGDGDTSDVTTTDAPAVNDENAFSGMVRQTTTFNGVETDPVSRTVSQPWQSPPTATRDMGTTTAYARYAQLATAWTGTKLAAGGWRVTRTDTTFDNAYGMPTAVDDAGDLGVSGDESCALTTYNRNTAKNIVNTASENLKYALSCATVASPGPASDADIISMIRTYYDGQGLSTPPVTGNLTTTQVAKAWTAAGGPVWLTQATSTYDPYGRALDMTDVRGNHTVTAFVPPSGGPVTSKTETTLLGTTTTTLEPSWGSPVAIVDINGKRSEGTYDALGRTAQVWKANRPKATFPTEPSTTYTYTVRNSGGVNAIATTTLNSAATSTVARYSTTYALFDGLMRDRQSQAISAANGNVGAVFTETKYDEQGRKVSESRHFDATVSPSTTLFTVLDWQPKTMSVTRYDRAGRTTAVVSMSAGVEKSRVTTAYGGDRMSVTPPAGGIASTTVLDAQGRTTQLRQYHDVADLGSDVRSTYDLTSYHINRKGQQDRITDNAGNVWTFAYDLLGRQTASHDPDKGDGTVVLNDAGDVVSTTDGAGTTLTYDHDAMGRKTVEYRAGTPAVKLASWAWDPPGAKGQLASSSRWVNGTDEYKVKVRGYTPLYQETGHDFVIPAVTAMTGLSGTYSTVQTYNYDGSLATSVYPNAGGLGAETLTYAYDPVTGLPEQLKTNSPGLGQYVSNTDYTAYAEMSFVQYNVTSGSYVQRSFTYDDSTHALTNAVTIRQTAPQAVSDVSFGYDAGGNVTRIAQTPASGTADVQCFDYDYARRLSQAWTPGAGSCTTAPSADALAGPAPYWQSWSFDAAGNRKTQTTHTAAGNTVATSAYPAAGGVRPHAVTSIAIDTPGTDTVSTYGYDDAGRTTSRPGITAPQSLTWDAEGSLATSTEAGAPTTYTYTVDGSRLVADEPDSVTLFLPGMDITRTKSTGAVTAKRYYEWGGQACAFVSTGGALTWLITDQQNSAQISIAAGTQAITQRWQTPYGTPRGGAVTWPTSKGFVGGNDDATGLTHLGAREYDPAIGRFISVDPIFDPKDPQSMTGYAYSSQTPVTLSDASGQRPICDGPNGSEHACAVGEGGWYPQSVAPPPPPCTMPLPGGGCARYGNGALPKQVRQGNLDNGSDKMALDSAARNQGASCEVRQYQIYCFNVTYMWVPEQVPLPIMCMGCRQQYTTIEVKITLPERRCMTIGDVVMFNGSKADFEARLASDEQENKDLEAKMVRAGDFDYDYDQYRRNLEGHEANHAEQWAQQGSVNEFLVKYGLGSLKSYLTDGTPDTHNPFEVGANPYWGGYWDPPEPQKHYFIKTPIR